jgi:hypothetical protein
MKVELQRRAEIALRSLQGVDRKQVLRAIQVLEISDRSALQAGGKLRLIRLGQRGKVLFLYVASPKFRFVISFRDADYCIVQDILHHDQIERLVKYEGQE